MSGHEIFKLAMCFLGGVGSCGILANALNWYTIVREFENHSLNYIHFRTNTRRKGMNPHIPWGSPDGIKAKVLACSLEVSEFELQPWYYMHFWTNTRRKGMNPLIPKIMG